MKVYFTSHKLSSVQTIVRQIPFKIKQYFKTKKIKSAKSKNILNSNNLDWFKWGVKF